MLVVFGFFGGLPVIKYMVDNKRSENAKNYIVLDKEKLVNWRMEECGRMEGGGSVHSCVGLRRLGNVVSCWQYL